MPLSFMVQVLYVFCILSPFHDIFVYSTNKKFVFQTKIKIAIIKNTRYLQIAKKCCLSKQLIICFGFS